ncbi:GAF domain-containing protein [Sphingomonas sp. 66-10]|mgnify:CR=1 FL=1|uniref:hybrid sensor histidine kinase/response regulator n=1 Tax=Sphingomonas sp. 66-10 TaxID=1895848 RepID=UPI000A4AEE4B|nr:GAF domain-containing protein [Sphingomonas sp. 66-10]
MSERWNALFDAAERLARARALDEVVDVVRKTARNVTDAQGVTFVVREGDHCHYIAEDAIAPLWAGRSFSLSECVPGWVMLHGEPAIIPDVRADPRVPKDFYRGTFVESVVMMPVRAGADEAAIGAYWSEPGAPDDTTVELIRMLARYVGAAIANVALQDSFELLNRTAAAVAVERDLDTIVQMVTDAGVELTGAEFGAFFYNEVDEKGERYTLYSLSGAPREAFARFPMPRNTEVFAPTFTGTGVVRSDNIRLDPRYGKSAPYHGMPEGHLPVTSYLAVPVKSRSGEVHGGLFFGHHQEARFTADHETALLGIAGHAAIAIDNARLNQATEAEIRARRAAEAELRYLNASLEHRIAERTAEIQAQADRLAESERHFRMLVEGVSDYAIYLLDPQGNITNWNPGAERIKGYNADEILGRNFSTFYTEEDREAGIPARALEIATRTGRYESEGWRIRKDGSQLWVSAVIDAIRDKDGQLVGFAKITRDLTEKREIEEQLRQSQKMEAVGQLTGGIAHDFNNLLTIITGNIDIALRMLENPADGGRVRRAIGNAMKGAERASALTQRLLAFSRRQPLAPKPLDLDKVVAGLSDLLKRSLGELIHLEVVSSPGLWPVEADPNQLESALVNLAVNARDAIADSGTLTIETANAYLDTDYAASHAEVPPGNYVVIAVSDTGVGMPRDVLARVFEPFFTTKEVGHGTGLGLSQVYGFVKQSGGHVNVYSEEGCGTTVKIYLPRFTGASIEEDAPVETAYEPRSARGEAVLVVEDDAEVRAFSADVLRDAGYQVLEAGDGAAALRILERRNQRVDLLFTDVVMPGLSGRELSDRARQLRPNLKVLYTSGYTRNAIVHGGRLDPGVELLPKPFTSRSLMLRVRDLLDARTGKRLLLIEDDPAVRTLAIEALRSAGYLSEPAANAAEGLGRLRAAQGGYDAVVIATGPSEKDSDALLKEIRGQWADLPVLITGAASPSAESAQAVVRLVRPYTVQSIIDGLKRLGIT